MMMMKLMMMVMMVTVTVIVLWADKTVDSIMSRRRTLIYD